MAELLDESRPLPFRPGDGPFHIKGVAYRGHLEYVAEQLPGGVDEMLKGFRDPALVTFFQQKFLPSAFYDIVPLVVAGYVCARQARKPFSEFLRMRSRWQAQKDISGIYKMLLKLVSPLSAMERLPALMSQYMDFGGEREFKKLSDKSVDMRATQVPLMLAPWFSTVMETYAQVVLAAAGGKNVLVRSLPFENDGTAHGQPTGQWRATVSWE